MAAGVWSNIYGAVWGEAFVLEVSGVIQARIILSVDVAVLDASGFCLATSIT